MINVSGQTETKYYYHFDGLGSVVALTDTNADIVEQYNYDVFGTPNTASSIGNPYMFTGREYDTETGNYYYRARYYKPSIGRFLSADPVAQFMQIAATQRLSRYDIQGIYISPVGMNKFLRKVPTGRFLQTDPYGLIPSLSIYHRHLFFEPLKRYKDGLNIYAYVGNNSVNYIDPLGLSCGPGTIGDLLWPDGPFKEDCDNHDKCYEGKGKYNCNTPKDKCDDDFCDDMANTCGGKLYGSSSQHNCLTLGTMNCYLAKEHGGGRFNKERKKNCPDDCE